MNREQFWTKLKKRAKLKGFSMSNSGEEIRENGTGKCPVCAVAEDVVGSSSKCDAETDGQNINLKLSVIDKIVQSSDSSPYFLTKTCKEYRAKLRKILKLQEVGG